MSEQETNWKYVRQAKGYTVNSVIEDFLFNFWTFVGVLFFSFYYWKSELLQFLFGTVFFQNSLLLQSLRYYYESDTDLL